MSDADTDRPGPLTCRREDFSLPREVHYLNCAYMSPMPRVTEEVGIEGIRKKRVPSSILPDDFFSDSDQLRSLFATLVNVSDPDTIAIHPSVSYGVAVAARNTQVRKGQNLVLLHEQFPGNVYSWRRLAQESEAELRTVMPGEGKHRGREWNARLLEAIDADTAVVALPQVHWTDGTLFDLKAIGARAREVGAAFVVDATQSVGALPFDVQEIQPDALICAGYKWMLGPYSVALTYLGPRFAGATPLEETWIGRKNSEDFQGLVDYQDAYQPGAIRFDVGERSNFILVPMLAESLRLIVRWTPERIQEYCRTLTAELLAEATSLGFTVEEEEFRAGHLFGLRMPEGIELSAVKEALERRKVYASLRGSALRVGPNVYNDAEDVAALIEALREVA